MKRWIAWLIIVFTVLHGADLLLPEADEGFARTMADRTPASPAPDSGAASHATCNHSCHAQAHALGLTVGDRIAQPAFHRPVPVKYACAAIAHDADAPPTHPPIPA